MWIEIEYQDPDRKKIVNFDTISEVDCYEQKRRHFSEPANLEGESGRAYFDDNNEYWSQVVYFVVLKRINDLDDLFFEFLKVDERDTFYNSVHNLTSAATIKVNNTEKE